MQSRSIFILNPGSATIKWAWFRNLEDQLAEESGQLPADDFCSSMSPLLSKLDFQVAIIRFVHGGNQYAQPVQIDDQVLQTLYELAGLAPLHNQRSLDCAAQLRRLLPGIELYAAFDTEFFQDLPEVAQVYGIPLELQRRLGIRRFGFHGFAHKAMCDTWAQLQSNTEYPHRFHRLITIQLGSGCSMAAISAGHPIETSMGFSPNEGLLMRTRSGDIDPGLLTWLQAEHNWTTDEVETFLNQRCGWEGMSGRTVEFDALSLGDTGDAQLAVRLFIHRVRKLLGAYFILLGGVDGVILSGGVAEHSPQLCRQILAGLEHIGIVLSPETLVPAQNPNLGLRQLSSNSSNVACWVMNGREEIAMLQSLIRHESPR